MMKKRSWYAGKCRYVRRSWGLLGTKSTVDNEAEILKTRFLMEQVAKDLSLNITVYEKGRVKNIEVYQSPFKLQIIKAADTIKNTDLSVVIGDNEKFSVSSKDFQKDVKVNQIFNLPRVGTVKLVNGDLPKRITKKEFLVNIRSIDAAVASLQESLTVEVKNKLITIVDLKLQYPLPKKGEVILSKLIEKYVQENLRDKNEIADSTVKFIQNRLAYIGGELGDLEGNIQGFKQRNNLADMSEQSKQLVQVTSDYVKQLAQVETQISIMESLQQYLKDADNKRVLPSSLIPADLVFSGAVEKYNQLTLERARKLIGMTENNPSIILIDKEIQNARADIESNLATTLDGFLITKRKLKAQMQQAEGQVKDVPKIERSYLNLARQQQIKQELYIFLMQKAEETAISKTSNIANSKTIDPAKSDYKPFSPNKN